MDFTTRELLKRYAKLAIGQPFSPILLNILVTSVCDMRCTHCFFTDELDDRPRKKLQMKTSEIEQISETLGGNLGVLILAGGEPFTRKDLPEIAQAFYKNNKLESIYIMSNGQIQKRIFPDITRILEECPNLNVTVALGIDGSRLAVGGDSAGGGLAAVMTLMARSASAVDATSAASEMPSITWRPRAAARSSRRPPR